MTAKPVVKRLRVMAITEDMQKFKAFQTIRTNKHSKVIAFN
jgi:hypothetical protein